MMQYKLSYREARELVAEGRTNLGQEGTSDWDERLLGECSKLIESKQNCMGDTTGRDGRWEQVGTDKALHAPASASMTSGDEHSDCASTRSRRMNLMKRAASWASGKQKSTGVSNLSSIRPGPTRNRSYIDHYIGPGEDTKSCVVGAKDVGDNHSEATAAEIECDASFTDRSITSRQEDNVLGEGNQGHLDVDEIKRNEVLIKQAMQLTKAHNQIKKTDEESTVTTVESSLSDIPAIIYVVRDMSHLNRNTKNRSILNRGKPKNLLGRIRKSFVSRPIKGSDMLDEDSPEAYENTFVSI